MNFYHRYSADYIAKTLQLGMLEDGAYNRLLDWYYTNEKPIPDSQKYAIGRATTRREKDAINTVLGSFFDRVNDVWTNQRADDEIAAARPKINAARANGKLGGRPKKTIEVKPTGFLGNNPMGSEKETQAKPTGYPSGLTPQNYKHLKDQDQKKRHARTADADALFPGIEKSLVADFTALRKAKRAPVTETAVRGIQREADKAGMTLAAALAVCCERGWTGFRAEWLQDSRPRGSPSKPVIAQNFSGKTYTGTQDRDLPEFLRAAST